MTAPSPCIVLHTPQLGENIGATARVMANFALWDLRLVAPRDGWPNPAAETMSAGAFAAGVTVRVYPTLEEAIGDCVAVVATTARVRDMEKPVLSLPQSLAFVREMPGRAAILFGAERAGLPNEAVALADAILTYPVNAGFASLNLAQAVAVFAHGWAASEATASLSPPPRSSAPAERAELIGLFEHFEDELDRAGFFFPAERRPVMIRNLRSALIRAEWSSQEVRTFRGAVKALALGRGKARIDRPPEE
jgi:tRNA/rRNA methyltransferase